MAWFRTDAADDAARDTEQEALRWWVSPPVRPADAVPGPDFEAVVGSESPRTAEIPVTPEATAVQVEDPAAPAGSEAEGSEAGGSEARDTEPEAAPPEAPAAPAPPIADLGLSFGERIERLIAAAVTEADQTRADAQRDAAEIARSTQLDAEHAIAAAQRQAAEIVASNQRRCDDQLAAAGRARAEAEQVLSEARDEAGELRRRVRDEVDALRSEVDLHAQAMLARTHADTNRTLAAARAELEEIAHRKTELEEQLAAIRALLDVAVVEPLPQQVTGFLGDAARGHADPLEAQAPPEYLEPTIRSEP